MPKSIISCITLIPEQIIMESPQHFSIVLPLLSSILLILVIIITFKTLGKQKYSLKNLPPGPPRLPIIGNLHNMKGEYPHRRLLALAKTYGPIFYLKLGEIDTVVITSPAIAAETMKTHDINLASRSQFLATKIILYDGGDLVFAPYGKVWAQLRKICTVELFSGKRVKSFASIMEEVGHNMVEKIRMGMTTGSSVVNISELLLAVANTTVSRTAFGRDCEQSERLFTAVLKSFKYMSGFDLADLYPSWSFVIAAVTGLRRRSENVRRDFDVILNEILEAHLEKTSDGTVDEAEEDLVDVMLRLKKSGELEDFITMDNIKAVIVDLILGGTETTSVIMAWGISEIFGHPRVMHKLQQELRNALNGKKMIEEKDTINLPYLNMVLKEIMRLHPPAPFLVPRHCQETIKLAGYTIPAGSRVILNAWAIMRDQSYWEDADSFRPERFEDIAKVVESKDAYIPFGGGRRVCPGINFGMRSMENVIGNLLYHFDWELPEGKKAEEVDMEEAFGLSLVRKNDLLLVPTPYNYI